MTTATTFLGATDALFDRIEGSRGFDIGFGLGTGLLCFAVAAPMLWWIVSKRPVSYFGRAVDPRGWLQFAWGLFGMFMTFTNFGCRWIPHHHLDWVHPGFLIITASYVTAFAPRVVHLVLRSRRAGVALAAGALAIALTAFAAPDGARAADLPSAPPLPPPPAGAVLDQIASSCGASAHVVPVHGVIRARTFAAGSGAPGRLRAALDTVEEIRPAGLVDAPLISEREAASPLEAGDTFDAELVTCAKRAGGLAFVDAHRAPPFVAGLPDRAPVTALAAGAALPHLALVDQDGHAVDLGDSHGKILLLSFVFTRCPDRAICPAISGKFSYMQHHLDPARYHLALVTLDPPYDSPRVMESYGRSFETDPARWSLLTGEENDIKHLLEGFGLTSLANHPGQYLHDDELIIARGDGTIDRIVDTAGWNPDDVLAQAQMIGGDASNPLRRIELASIAQVAAFCGGGESVGVVVLDSVVFLLGVLILGSILVWWGRQIFVHDA